MAGTTIATRVTGLTRTGLPTAISRRPYTDTTVRITAPTPITAVIATAIGIADGTTGAVGIAKR